MPRFSFTLGLCGAILLGIVGSGLVSPIAAAVPDASGKDLRRQMEMLGGNGITYFLDAAARGDLPAVETMRRAGMDVNVRDAEGCSALACAAAKGQLAMIEKLLAEGADLDAADRAGRTALHYAVAAENLPAVELLLKRGADGTRSAHDGRDALGYALATDDLALKKVLLAAAPADLKWNDVTCAALVDAVENRDRELAPLLLAKHRDPPPLAPGRELLLAYAIAANDLDKLRFLLSCGADPNAPLTVPAERDFLKLFSGNMLPYYLTKEPGMTPLMLAAGLGRPDIVQTLLEHGARRGSVTAKWQLAALTFAAWANNAPSLLVLLGKSPRLDAQPARVEISLSRQRANFYKGDTLALSSPVSTGKSGHATPTGEFVITDKYVEHKSTIYKVSMPYFMRLNCREFGMHQGVVPNYPASHGCIRMPGDKARQLFKEVEIGTLVTIAN